MVLVGDVEALPVPLGHPLHVVERRQVGHQLAGDQVLVARCGKPTCREVTSPPVGWSSSSTEPLPSASIDPIDRRVAAVRPWA